MGGRGQMFTEECFGRNYDQRALRPENKKENEMKKQTLFSIFFIATLLVFSMSHTPAVFAGTTSHTITIINNSDTELAPTNNPHAVVFNSSNTACTAVPPDTCGTVNLTPPSKVAANSQAVINFSGPSGCNISAWQSYYKPGKGNVGTIQCGMSPVNVCNSVATRNFTCTISQANVNTAKGGSNVGGTSQ